MGFRRAFRVVVGLDAWFAGRFDGWSGGRWFFGLFRQAGPRRRTPEEALKDAERLPATPPENPPEARSEAADRWL